MTFSLRNRLLLFLGLVLSLTALSGAGVFFQSYQGFMPAQDLPPSFHARILSIVFDRRDAFDGSVAHGGMDRKIFALGNKLHMVSREATIRRRLLFKVGQEADKLLLTETEKALRSEEFLADAVIEVKSLDNGTCEIRITTFDQWTTMPAAGASVLGQNLGDLASGRIPLKDIPWWAGISESNFLGGGTRLGAAIRHDLERDAQELIFKNQSLTPLNLQMTAFASLRSDGDSLQFSLDKPLRSSADRVAYGIDLLSVESSERLYFDANRLASLPKPIAKAGAGHFHVIRQFEKTGLQQINVHALWSYGYARKFDIGPTFEFRDHYGQGGLGEYDTALAALSPPLPASAEQTQQRRDALAGMAMNWYRYEYQSIRNYHNLKWNESLALGWRLNAKIALNQPWLGADRTDVHLKQDALFSDAWFNQVYLSMGASCQTFVSASGLKDGQADAFWETQWKPHPITATVLAGSWSHLFATPQSRQLVLGEVNGLNGFPSFYYSGQARFLATAEQRIFPASEFLTLVPALSAIFSAGNTFPSYADLNFEKLHYSAGLGLMLGRSKSTTKVVQHINICWPLGEELLPGPVITILAKKSL